MRLLVSLRLDTLPAMQRSLRFIAFLVATSIVAAACPEATTGTPDVADVADTSDATPDVASDVVADVAPDIADAEPDVPTGPVDLSSPVEAGAVAAGITLKASDLLTGPKAEGQIGDIKLYNAHVAFIVEGARIAGGWREQGGHPVDAAVVGWGGDPTATSPDLYGELFPIWNLDIFYPDTVEVISDGRDGLAHVRVTGASGPFDLATGFLDAILSAPEPSLAIKIDYKLGPDDRSVGIETTITNTAAESIVIDSLMMTAHGDGAKMYSPAGHGWNIESSAGTALRYFGAVGRDHGYGYAVESGDLKFLLAVSAVSIVEREGFTLAPSAARLERTRLAVAGGSADGLDAWWRQRYGSSTELASLGFVNGIVEVPAEISLAEAYVVVWDGNDVATATTLNPDATFAATVPSGPYELEVIVPNLESSGRVPVDIVSGETATSTISLPAGAQVTVLVNDDAGSPIAARVTFVREGATPDPTPPTDAQLYEVWGGSTTQVAYANRGATTIYLPAGEYRAVASRGLSWELDEQVVTVAANSPQSLTFSLVRAVDTTGWISSDLHVHAFHSPDSGVPYNIRALQAATDDLDLPLITEHLAVGKLGSVLEDVSVADLVLEVPGQELTTLNYGHFISFPSFFDPLAVNFGAIYPLDKTAPELFAAVRASTLWEQIISVAHPRDALGPFAYFDYVGLDATAMTVTNTDSWSTDFDAVEAFNGSCSRDSGDHNAEAVEDWMGMTNFGLRKTLVGGSDSHDIGKPAGVPRTWIPVTAAAAKSDVQAVVSALKQRRAVVSCGPFVRFTAADGTMMGEMTGVDGAGVATFNVRVEAPTWITLDAVNLLENGVVIDTIALTGGTDPVVRFDGVMTATPIADAWYAIEVVGSGSLQPVHKSGPPYALTNAIEVDQDGDGSWTPPTAP